MKFLVDAQLPRHLSDSLKWWGHDVVHTSDLPAGDRTPDWRINDISLAEQRVVITKDADFVSSLLITSAPFKLLLVSTGNISNRALVELFEKNLSAIVAALEIYDYVEITRGQLIEHR